MKRYIDDHAQNIISDLKGFVDIPSVSSDKENVDKALDYVLQLAKIWGLRQSVLNHQVGVIEIGEGKRRSAFYLMLTWYRQRIPSLGSVRLLK